MNDHARAALLSALGGEYSPSYRDTDAQCYLPDFLGDGRAWGITLQLYELRSANNWGIGDFADLARLCEAAARAGADFIGLNPLHALFTAEPSRCSPFSPSSRQFLNPIYISVDLLDPDGRHRPDHTTMERLRRGDFVDYDLVARSKLAALHSLFLEQSQGRPGRAAPLEDADDRPMRRHALFEALSHHMVRRGYGAGWLSWPLEYQDVSSSEVRAFEQDHLLDVEFHLWLQKIARSQLQAAAAAGRDAGLRIGLFLDFAVGEAPDGSATWSGPSDYLRGVTVGAPPDVFSTEGQNWGLSALSPRRLEEDNAGPFRQLIDAVAASAGALRVDHAMALRQLFLVPDGRNPADGAYVPYPYGLLVDELAASSHRHRTIVIGEDLGVVPPGFRDAMARAQMLSYRILYFEQHEGDGSFISPDAYPRLALACLSTHDLPTLSGWWDGHDLTLREQFGLVDSASTQWQRERRHSERRALAHAAGVDPDRVSPAELTVAVHRLVARTSSVLAAVRLADIVGEYEPTNLPGTSDTYPNWRRKLAPALEAFESLPLWNEIGEAMRQERPKP